MTTPVATPLQEPFGGTETDREWRLLQDNAHVLDGKHRLSTPDKNAIMTLSKSFTKRRLGKQQQLLQDITLRCREQDIAELSGGITKKVNLKEPAEISVAKELANYANQNTKGNDTPPNPPENEHDVTGGATRNAGIIGSVTGTACISISCKSSEVGLYPSLARASTMFPQRKVLKNQRKNYSTSLPRLNISYRKGVTPSDTYNHRTVVLNQQQINGQIQLRHYLQPRSDHLAPLVLPSIQYIGLANDVNSYMHAKRINITVAPRTGKAQIQITARSVSNVWLESVCSSASVDTSHILYWRTQRHLQRYLRKQ